MLSHILFRLNVLNRGFMALFYCVSVISYVGFVKALLCLYCEISWVSSLVFYDVIKSH